MSDHVLVEAESLADEIAEVNHFLQNRIGSAHSCISFLKAYCAEKRLKGAAYSNSQQYFTNTYIPLLNQVIYACKEIIELNNTILPTFSSYVPNTRGFVADTHVIESEINRLKDENAYLQRKIDEYLYNLSMLPFHFSPNNSGLVIWYQSKIKLNNNTISKLQEIVDNLRAFDADCAGIYDETIALTRKLASAISELRENCWNNNQHFLVPDAMVDKFMEIEYEKMVFHNPDGSISLNKDYVASLFQKEVISGTSTEIASTYLALIKTFENINTSEDMEAFLNFCYIKREISVTDSTKYSDNMMSAYEYFHKHPIAQDNVHFEYTLSPVFNEMMQYYNSTVIPGILANLYGSSNIYSEQEARNALTRSGILQNLAVYGNQTYSWEIVNKAFHPITVQMDEYKFEMKIVSSDSFEISHDIVQYPYSSSQTNALYGKDIGFDYIQGTITTWQSLAKGKIEDYIIDKLITGIGLLCPEFAVTIKGSNAAVNFLGSILNPFIENASTQNILDAMSFTDAMDAFGLDGQLCIVDGQLQCQYLHLDSEKFLENFAAYNLHDNRPDRTIDELCNSPDEIQDFIKFCNYDVHNGAVEHYANDYYDGSIDELINNNTSENDRNNLMQSINDHFQTVIGETP